MKSQEFAHALSGKPEAVSKTVNKVLQGYIIRDMLNHIYTTNTTIHLNKWRNIKEETDLFWVIEEKLNPIIPTSFVLYKNKITAEEHLLELK